MQLFRRGSVGPAVSEIRSRLAQLGHLTGTERSAPEPTFDEACEQAVRAFQQERGLSADGIVGRETYRALDEARWGLGDRVLFHAVNHPFAGDDVADLQQRLLDMGFDPGRCDGVFGATTDRALREFQRNVGIAPDGLCGPATLRALNRLERTVRGGHPQWMRESEELHRAGPALAGKLVVIDPGHGGTDPGATGHGLAESAVVEDIARRLEGRLAATGVAVYLTRGSHLAQDGAPTPEQRAAFANAVGADLCISLHVDSCPSPHARGAATYYYGWREPGRGGGGSAVGERLAALMQGELVARTGLVDCRSHPKTWELLRRTRMPAVQVELGYLTSPLDALRLADPSFRDMAAEAILVAVQRLYLPPELDAPTGELRLSGLAQPVSS